jgi:spore coat polysaccharide biosynthesis protein SpsF (cytidylyltransferase family)
MKTVCIVQARTTSERFPCKIFAALRGRPMLAHVLERAAAIQGVDQVVLAVPDNDVKLVAHLWPYVFGGSEKDVLGRYAAAAEKYEADIIVRVTGDCPLLAPELVFSPLDSFILAGTGLPHYFPICQPFFKVADGWDAEIFTREMLVLAEEKASKWQREHVTTWMREYSSIESAEIGDWTALKCSVDTREDLQRVEAIMSRLDDPTDFSHIATWHAWEKAGRP